MKHPIILVNIAIRAVNFVTGHPLIAVNIVKMGS